MAPSPRRTDASPGRSRNPSPAARVTGRHGIPPGFHSRPSPAISLYPNIISDLLFRIQKDCLAPAAHSTYPPISPPEVREIPAANAPPPSADRSGGRPYGAGSGRAGFISRSKSGRHGINFWRGWRTICHLLCNPVKAQDLKWPSGKSYATLLPSGLRVGPPRALLRRRHHDIGRRAGHAAHRYDYRLHADRNGGGDVDVHLYGTDQPGANPGKRDYTRHASHGH
jgi:hypothetical protein